MKKILAVLVVLAVLLTACAAPMADMGGVSGSVPQESVAAADEAKGYAGENGQIVQEDVSAKERDPGLGSLSNASIPQTNRKLIYTATFGIATREYEQDYKKILSALETHQGYVESESTSGTAPQGVGDSGRSTSFILRVPVDQYDSFLKELSGIGTLQYKNMETEDVSSEYYDVESRIELLTDRYERLKEHLSKATKTSDIIELEEELSNVLYELDGLKGQRKHMDELIQYTKVMVDVTEQVNAGTITAQEGTFGERAGDAFADTMTAMGEFFTDFGIGFVGALPVLIVLAVIAGIVLGIIFGVRKHKKSKEK